MRAKKNFARNERLIQAEFVSDAIGLFFRLEDTGCADVHNQCLYGNDVYLLANVSEQRKIVLTTMTDIENDMAEIRFVDCGKRMMTLRFVREL